MRIRRLVIENCKSYRNREEFTLDRNFNVLVGPNGGGKSNTLDIITVLLRRFFLFEYGYNTSEEAAGFYRDITTTPLFADLRRHLDRNIDRPRDPTFIEVELVVGKSDVENLNVLRACAAELKRGASFFRSVPVQVDHVIDELSAFAPEVGSTVLFEVVDGALTHTSNDLGDGLLKYANFLNLFLLLAAEVGVTGLKPCFSYFSPYRAASWRDLRATLSNESFRGHLASYANASSRESGSLIKLATLYFADLRLNLEKRARQSGFQAEWDRDPVVKQVTKYLRQIGYEWDISSLDASRNSYEITLTRDSRTFSVDQASSGEKEILTFVLGLFALRTEGGLVVIDEPEVHLHPRWQGMLRDLLQDLATETDNQLVLTTHSPIFITPRTISHVARVSRSNENATKISRYASTLGGDQTKNWHLLNSHNNERVFFADRVVLVEGIQDRILFDAVLRAQAKSRDYRGVVEVVEVHGKENFKTYEQLLRASGIPCSTIADLDYVSNIGPPALRQLFEVDHEKLTRKVLRNKGSKDRGSLAETLGRLLALFDQRLLRRSRFLMRSKTKAVRLRDVDGQLRLRSLRGALAEVGAIWEYIKGRHRTLRADLSEEERNALQAFLTQLSERGIHVLRHGTIETYLPSKSRSLSGTIELVRESNLRNWLNSQDRAKDELVAVCDAILFPRSEPTN